MQINNYGLLVSDPEVLYEAGEGALLKRLQAKLAAHEAGEEPPVALTFAEAKQVSETAGDE